MSRLSAGVTSLSLAGGQVLPRTAFSTVVLSEVDIINIGHCIGNIRYLISCFLSFRYRIKL